MVLAFKHHAGADPGTLVGCGQLYASLAVFGRCNAFPGVLHVYFIGRGFLRGYGIGAGSERCAPLTTRLFFRYWNSANFATQRDAPPIYFRRNAPWRKLVLLSTYSTIISQKSSNLLIRLAKTSKPVGKSWDGNQKQSKRVLPRSHLSIEKRIEFPFHGDSRSRSMTCQYF